MPRPEPFSSFPSPDSDAFVDSFVSPRPRQRAAPGGVRQRTRSASMQKQNVSFKKALTDDVVGGSIPIQACQHEGTLSLMIGVDEPGLKKRRQRKRYFLLGYQSIEYFESRELKATTKPHGTIMLSDVLQISENHQNPLAFIIQCQFRKYELFAGTMEERDKWVSVLRDFIDKMSEFISITSRMATQDPQVVLDQMSIQAALLQKIAKTVDPTATGTLGDLVSQIRSAFTDMKENLLQSNQKASRKSEQLEDARDEIIVMQQRLAASELAVKQALERAVAAEERAAALERSALAANRASASNIPGLPRSVSIETVDWMRERSAARTIQTSVRHRLRRQREAEESARAEADIAAARTSVSSKASSAGGSDTDASDSDSDAEREYTAEEYEKMPWKEVIEKRKSRMKVLFYEDNDSDNELDITVISEEGGLENLNITAEEMEEVARLKKLRTREDQVAKIKKQKALIKVRKAKEAAARAAAGPEPEPEPEKPKEMSAEMMALLGMAPAPARPAPSSDESSDDDSDSDSMMASLAGGDNPLAGSDSDSDCSDSGSDSDGGGVNAELLASLAEGGNPLADSDSSDDDDAEAKLAAGGNPLADSSDDDDAEAKLAAGGNPLADSSDDDSDSDENGVNPELLASLAGGTNPMAESFDEEDLE